MQRLILTSCAALMAGLGPAAASTMVTVTIGDDDCFGLDIACPDFIAEPAAADQPFDKSTASDPANQDVFGAIGQSSFEVTLDLKDQRISDVTLSARIWGAELASFPPGTHPGPFGDAFAGTRFIVNGVDVGTYAASTDFGPLTIDRVETVSFDVLASTLVSGINTITVIPEEDFIDLIGLPETYALDFVELRYHTMPIPLPGSLPLGLGALGLLGWAGRARP